MSWGLQQLKAEGRGRLPLPLHFAGQEPGPGTEQAFFSYLGRPDRSEISHLTDINTLVCARLARAISPGAYELWWAEMNCSESSELCREAAVCKAGRSQQLEEVESGAWACGFMIHDYSFRLHSPVRTTQNTRRLEFH